MPASATADRGSTGGCETSAGGTAVDGVAAAVAVVRAPGCFRFAGVPPVPGAARRSAAPAGLPSGVGAAVAAFRAAFPVVGAAFLVGDAAFPPAAASSVTGAALPVVGATFLATGAALAPAAASSVTDAAFLVAAAALLVAAATFLVVGAAFLVVGAAFLVVGAAFPPAAAFPVTGADLRVVDAAFFAAGAAPSPAGAPFAVRVADFLAAAAGFPALPDRPAGASSGAVRVVPAPAPSGPATVRPPCCGCPSTRRAVPGAPDPCGAVAARRALVRSAMASPIYTTVRNQTVTHSDGWQRYGSATPPTTRRTGFP